MINNFTYMTQYSLVESRKGLDPFFFFCTVEKHHDVSGWRIMEEWGSTETSLIVYKFSIQYYKPYEYIFISTNYRTLDLA
jgi:hypothetical protein